MTATFWGRRGLSEHQGEQDPPRVNQYRSLILHTDAPAQLTPQSRSILPARFPSARPPDIYKYLFLDDLHRS